MAYVQTTNNDDDEEVNKKQGVDLSDGTVPNSGSTTGITTASDGTGGGSGSAGQNSASPDFVGINDYLDTNKEGSEQLGQTVAGGLGNTISQASGAISNAQSQFANAAEAARIKYNQDAVDKTIASGQANDDFNKLLNATYTGPRSWSDAGIDTQGVSDAVNKATQQGQLANTQGGRTQLLQEIINRPVSLGGTNLNSALLSGNEKAVGSVKAAAAPAAGLAGAFSGAQGQSAGLVNAISSQNQQVKNQAIGAVTNYLKDQDAAYNTALTQAQKDQQDKNFNLKSYLNTFSGYGQGADGKFGWATPEANAAAFQAMGITPEQATNLGRIISIAGPNSVNLADFFKEGSSPTTIRTQEEADRLNALAKLAGLTNHYTAGNDSQAATFDYAGALQKANFAAGREKQPESNGAPGTGNQGNDITGYPPGNSLYVPPATPTTPSTGATSPVGAGAAGALGGILGNASNLNTAYNLIDVGGKLVNAYNVAGLDGLKGTLQGMFSGTGIGGSGFGTGLAYGNADIGAEGLGAYLGSEAGTEAGTSALAGAVGEDAAASLAADAGGGALAAEAGVAVVPIIGWIIAGMMAADSLYKAGYEGDDISYGNAAAFGIGVQKATNSALEKLGLSDHVANILSGASIPAYLMDMFGITGGGPKVTGVASNDGNTDWWNPVDKALLTNDSKDTGAKYGGELGTLADGMVDTATKLYQGVVKLLGGTGPEPKYQAFISADPQGDAPTMLNFAGGVPGGGYARSDLYGGIENVGRSEADINKAISLTLDQAVYSSLMSPATNINPQYKEYLSGLDIKSPTFQQDLGVKLQSLAQYANPAAANPTGPQANQPGQPVNTGVSNGAKERA